MLRYHVPTWPPIASVLNNDQLVSHFAIAVDKYQSPFALGNRGREGNVILSFQKQSPRVAFRKSPTRAT